jgi:hypothetical protein
LFRIRFFTPTVSNEHGWRHAGGELILGDTRLCFLVDLDYWGGNHYVDQWRDGFARLARGESSTAFMTAYRGNAERPHVMWGLWRTDTHICIQEHSVLSSDLDAPFDPSAPYDHLGEYVPTAVHGLPIPEWHVPIEQLNAALKSFRQS